MRIDVTFPRAIKHEEIAKIEQLMATAIAAAVDTEIAEKSLTEAKAEGVEATFGEKYGETVRTVRMGDFSYELCGGTHVPNIGIIGAVKIVSESGVSAGVRRIEAVCGLATQELLQSQFTELRSIAEKLKVPQSEMQNRLDVLFKERKELTNINGQLQKKLAVFEADELAEKAVIINNLKTVTLLERDADAKTIGQLARTITAKDVDVVIIQNKQGNVAIATSMKKNASELFKGITEQFGGGGGGSANFASGGGVQPLSENVAEEML
jgi:alanyl-tRNA synthetase